MNTITVRNATDTGKRWLIKGEEAVVHKGLLYGHPRYKDGEERMITSEVRNGEYYKTVWDATGRFSEEYKVILQ